MILETIKNLIEKMPSADAIANYEMSPEQIIWAIIVLVIVSILMFVYICWENDITISA